MALELEPGPPQVMLRLIFRRFRQHAREEGSLRALRRMVPDVPRGVASAFLGPLSLREYLALDDSAVTEFFKACATSKDQMLRELGGGLLNRRLFKAIDVTDAPAQSVANFKLAVVDQLRRIEVDPEYSIVDDNPSDVAYKAYDPDAERPETQIYIEAAGGLEEIGKLSAAVETLKRKYSLLRYYFPESVRDTVQAVASETLR